MNRVLSAAVSSLLGLGMISVVYAQNSSSSQDLRAAAKSVSNGSQDSTETAEPASDKTFTAGSPKAQKFYDSGTLLYNSGRLAEAIQAFKQATRLQPENAQSHYMLGMAQSKAKAYRESFESFKRAARFKADWPEAQFRLGVMSYVLGKRPQAVEAYNNLLKLDPSLANTLNRIIKDQNNQAAVTAGVTVGNWELNQTEVASDSVPAKTDSKSAVGGSDPVPLTSSGSPAASQPTTILTKPAPRGTEARPIASGPTPAAEDPALTGIYRIGVGDVLDIRLLNSSTPRSTLYTVIDGGLIDLALAGGPIGVVGLTTDEIQTRIASELKRRAIGDRVSVGVRQYASHNVVITGLVDNPGTKFLRREAVPLYVIMAEVQARSDAGRVTIMRSGSAGLTLDLSDPTALNSLVRPGDIINVSARPQEFYYIAGRINYPGQKSFQPGITLMQAILASGGLVRQSDNAIEVSREGQDGRLETTKFKFKEIKTGKIQDPRLRPGDRIQVMN